MSPSNIPPVATMTMCDTKDETEEIGLVPNEAAASGELKETNPSVGPITVIDTMKAAEEMDLEPVDLPNDPEKILTFSFDPKFPTMRPDKIVANTTVQIVRDKRQLTTKEYQVVGNILKALSSIGIFTTKNVKLLTIEWIVTCILGEASNVRGPYEYPESFQKVAVAVQARLDEEVPPEEVPDQTPPTPTSPPSTTAVKKRKRTSPTPGRSAARELADIHSPSYNGSMRGIVINDEGHRSYKLADKSMRVPANVFGHNGLQVGDWWPKWICALRDGAHGHTQGGIYSRSGVGAYSIVISGLYDDLDKDLGSTLYYSGNKSHDNTDPDQAFMTPAIRALQQSGREQRPIRVLRTSGGKASHCPAKGLRYDGLYRIVSEELAKNMKGGVYARFKLVRDRDQPDMDLSRPTQAEKGVYDRLRDSI